MGGAWLSNFEVGLDRPKNCVTKQKVICLKPEGGVPRDQIWDSTSGPKGWLVCFLVAPPCSQGSIVIPEMRKDGIKQPNKKVSALLFSGSACGCILRLRIAFAFLGPSNPPPPADSERQASVTRTRGGPGKREPGTASPSARVAAVVCPMTLGSIRLGPFIFPFVFVLHIPRAHSHSLLDFLGLSRAFHLISEWSSPLSPPNPFYSLSVPIAQDFLPERRFTGHNSLGALKEGPRHVPVLPPLVRTSQYVKRCLIPVAPKTTNPT